MRYMQEIIQLLNSAIIKESQLLSNLDNQPFSSYFIRDTDNIPSQLDISYGAGIHKLCRKKITSVDDAIKIITKTFKNYWDHRGYTDSMTGARKQIWNFEKLYILIQLTELKYLANQAAIQYKPQTHLIFFQYMLKLFNFCSNDFKQIIHTYGYQIPEHILELDAKLTDTLPKAATEIFEGEYLNYFSRWLKSILANTFPDNLISETQSWIKHTKAAFLECRKLLPIYQKIFDYLVIRFKAIDLILGTMIQNKKIWKNISIRTQEFISEEMPLPDLSEWFVYYSKLNQLRYECDVKIVSCIEWPQKKYDYHTYYVILNESKQIKEIYYSDVGTVELVSFEGALRNLESKQCINIPSIQTVFFDFHRNRSQKTLQKTPEEKLKELESIPLADFLDDKIHAFSDRLIKVCMQPEAKQNMEETHNEVLHFTQYMFLKYHHINKFYTEIHTWLLEQNRVFLETSDDVAKHFRPFQIEILDNLLDAKEDFAPGFPSRVETLFSSHKKSLPSPDTDIELLAHDRTMKKMKEWKNRLISINSANMNTFYQTVNHYISQYITGKTSPYFYKIKNHRDETTLKSYVIELLIHIMNEHFEDEPFLCLTFIETRKNYRQTMSSLPNPSISTEIAGIILPLNDTREHWISWLAKQLATPENLSDAFFALGQHITQLTEKPKINLLRYLIYAHTAIFMMEAFHHFRLISRMHPKELIADIEKKLDGQCKKIVKNVGFNHQERIAQIKLYNKKAKEILRQDPHPKLPSWLQKHYPYEQRLSMVGEELDNFELGINEMQSVKNSILQLSKQVEELTRQTREQSMAIANISRSSSRSSSSNSPEPLRFFSSSSDDLLKGFLATHHLEIDSTNKSKNFFTALEWNNQDTFMSEKELRSRCANWYESSPEHTKLVDELQYQAKQKLAGFDNNRQNYACIMYDKLTLQQMENPSKAINGLCSIEGPIICNIYNLQAIYEICFHEGMLEFGKADKHGYSCAQGNTEEGLRIKNEIILQARLKDCPVLLHSNGGSYWKIVPVLQLTPSYGY